MRLALKIAYDGRAFYGHQRQPDARTVEGECLRALAAAGILRDAKESFFRSASRTDRGVSAVGNVIAFRSALPPGAAVGAFNDKARGVWAWAVAEVPDSFHPRHAEERWYRYHLYDRYPTDRLREAGEAFVGIHDFRSFTSDPPTGAFAIHSVQVRDDAGATAIDVRARSFRRGMVRRIVAAMVSVAGGFSAVSDVRRALEGERRDFGSVPPEALFLMDVTYGVPFRPLIKPKALDEWRARARDADLSLRLLRALSRASGASADMVPAPAAVRDMC